VRFFGASLWGSLVVANGVLDTTRGTTFPALIIDKQEIHGSKGTYLGLVVLCPSSQSRRLQVNGKIFNNLNTGQHVAIVFHQGYFGWE